MPRFLAVTHRVRSIVVYSVFDACLRWISGQETKCQGRTLVLGFYFRTNLFSLTLPRSLRSSPMVLVKTLRRFLPVCTPSPLALCYLFGVESTTSFAPTFRDSRTPPGSYSARQTLPHPQASRTRPHDLPLSQHVFFGSYSTKRNTLRGL